MKNIFNYKNFLKKVNESNNYNNIVSKIDYTLLNPSATEDDILKLCEKAKKLGVKSVCVLPKMVRIASEALSNSEVLVCTVVSFPHGTNTPEEKLLETKKVIKDGADEVDMVLNYPKLQNLIDNTPENLTDDEEDYYYSVLDYLIIEVNDIVVECHSSNNKNGDPITLKVIVESGLLNDSATKEATHICLQANADFIKTSTGMVSVGAELNKVKLMRHIINEEKSNMKIKASGGLRTLSDLEKFEPYVDRFGVGFAAVDNIFGDSNTQIDGY